jgi:hypothetical protein
MNDNEQIALQRASSRKWLLTRLMSAKSCLLPQYKSHFKSPKFDFDTKRLNGDDGYYLQWQTREQPDEPPSYENQQTTMGDVSLLKRLTEVEIESFFESLSNAEMPSEYDGLYVTMKETK